MTRDGSPYHDNADELALDFETNTKDISRGSFREVSMMLRDKLLTFFSLEREKVHYLLVYARMTKERQERESPPQKITGFAISPIMMRVSMSIPLP